MQSKKTTGLGMIDDGEGVVLLGWDGRDGREMRLRHGARTVSPVRGVARRIILSPHCVLV